MKFPTIKEMKLSDDEMIEMVSLDNCLITERSRNGEIVRDLYGQPLVEVYTVTRTRSRRYIFDFHKGKWTKQLACETKRI